MEEKMGPSFFLVEHKGGGALKSQKEGCGGS